jgi:hypothetical protein
VHDFRPSPARDPAGSDGTAAKTTFPSEAGVVLALVTTAAVVAAAVQFRDVVLLAIGALGALNVLPAAITTWFPETVVAPHALLAVGATLVAVTLRGARKGWAGRTSIAVLVHRFPADGGGAGHCCSLYLSRWSSPRRSPDEPRITRSAVRRLLRLVYRVIRTTTVS